MPSPPFAASAMDGYAVRAGPAGRRLTVVGESRAGQPAETAVRDGVAVRISTGAVVPEGATAVVRQEDTTERDGTVEVGVQVDPGANIRAAGEDMAAGATVLGAGVRFGVAELGAAISAGAGTVEVSRRPGVAVLCTGDELRAPGEPLSPGQIHNSNGPMLEALAARAGADPRPTERVPDDRPATEALLGAALEHSDVVLVSGGVSVGPHDHVKPALEALGVSERFWRVALQPGKPTWFGVRDGTLVFGLPGNPVSVVVTFALFARVALDVLTGAAAPADPPTARLSEAVTRNPRREQAIRVSLRASPTGLWASPTGAQGSHIVTSLLGADALALVPAGSGRLEAGEEIGLEPLWSELRTR